MKLTRAQRARLLASGSAAAAACLVPAVGAGASPQRPPQISISTPKEGEVLETPTVLVEGTFTVASVSGPSPHVSATLDGRPLKVGVRGPVGYDFEGTATLVKGSNVLTVAVDDGDGGESSRSVTVRYRPLQPTRRQCVADRRGDSRDRLTHMDIVRACAVGRGSRVVFSVTTAHRPPHVHDGAGNPAAPCIEVFRGAPLGHGGPAPIQSCGDAQLRGYTIHRWPKVPFAISGRTSTWKVPLRYLPKGRFEWRAYLSEAERDTDTAPDRGFLVFVR